MKRKTFLDKIDVQSPCNENWDEMFGNDEIRFCSHCAKNVHNLSAMTRQKAEELVKNSKGGLCVRYVKNPSGKLVSAPKKLTNIKRRATIAASVLATSLALTTHTYAQGEPIVKKENVVQNDKTQANQDKSKQGFSTISGTIKDANDALILNAKVTLKDTKNEKIWETKTDENGEYIFRNLEPSVYEITAYSIGFKKLVISNIEVLKDSILEKNLSLEIEAIMGDIVVAPSDEIIKEIQSLPVNKNSSEIMNLKPINYPKEKSKNKKFKPKKKKN
jgi:hypothetical protein